MLKSICVASYRPQLQQVRFGHRIRGKAPGIARSLQDRLDELNYKDELYTTRINIGFTKKMKPAADIRKEHMAHVKKIKADKEIEQLARHNKLQIDIKEVTNEWHKTLSPYHRKTIAEHYGIYEHLYGEGFFVPFVNMKIAYNFKDDLQLPVYTGNLIKPIEAKEVPSVNYISTDDSLWTLALTSLDGHLSENEKEYVHWMVANIPGNSVEKGDTIVEYLQPFPLKGTGYHRYVFVLYKQEGRIDYKMPKVTSPTLENRTFVTRDWYKQHQDDVTPAGLSFFQCDWDESVREYFHNVLQMKEPVYEYDFPGHYIRPQEWFPLRQPFNLYMDRYRDPKQINKEYLLRKLSEEDPFKAPPPPLKFPNAQPLPKDMPSWLKLHERKIRMRWGRVNDV